MQNYQSNVAFGVASLTYVVFSYSGSLFLNDASNAHTPCETTWIHAKSTWNCNLAWIISSICSLLRLPFSLVIVSILDFPVDFSIADTRLGSPMDPSPDSAWCRRAKVTNLSWFSEFKGEEKPDCFFHETIKSRSQVHSRVDNCKRAKGSQYITFWHDHSVGCCLDRSLGRIM